MAPLLAVRGIRKSFPVHRGLLRRPDAEVRAVDGVDLEVFDGECLALVGESGSGKTTLARCGLRLIDPSAGEIRFAGEDLLALSAAQLRARRRDFQMIFQDPYASLSPRLTVDRILGEPLEIHRVVPKGARRERVRRLLELVGLPAESALRYPHELSGGQRQRIGIARALATEPRLLVADEPVSALDVSARAQIVNLLTDLQRRLGLGMLFIAHDLALIEQIANRVAVLYLGKVVEVAPASELFRAPLHPYTSILLSAVPVADPARSRRRILPLGEPASPANPPTGCRFHPRCGIARDRCRLDEPELLEWSARRRVACHFPGELEPEAGGKAGAGTF